MGGAAIVSAAFYLHQHDSQHSPYARSTDLDFTPGHLPNSHSLAVRKAADHNWNTRWLHLCDALTALVPYPSVLGEAMLEGLAPFKGQSASLALGKRPLRNTIHVRWCLIPWFMDPSSDILVMGIMMPGNASVFDDGSSCSSLLSLKYYFSFILFSITVVTNGISPMQHILSPFFF
jgi:hypothetical protein